MKSELLFHDQIIKTGKGESKFAIRYNIHGVSPYMGTKWNYNAKSVSIPPYDNKLICGADYCGEEFGIYAVEIGDFFLRTIALIFSKLKCHLLTFFYLNTQKMMFYIKDLKKYH